MMQHTLLALHGFTMNGEVLQSALGPLSAALSPKVRVVCLNAPHACSEATVTRMYGGLASERLSPPHLSWWNATDDGLEYRGWEDTFDVVSEALERYAPASVLGFSQGAILAAAVAALSQRGELPHVHGAVLIAGRLPRAARLAPALMDPIDVPSLHVWGTRDAVTGPFCQELADRFVATNREIAIWDGAHTIPTRGAAYDALLRFVQEHA
jgi:predicted esterase